MRRSPRAHLFQRCRENPAFESFALGFWNSFFTQFCNILPLWSRVAQLAPRGSHVGRWIIFSGSRKQSCKSGRAVRVGPGFGPGSGLSLSTCFGPISGLHTQVFLPFQVTIFFFREVLLFCSLRWLLWVKWLWFFFSLFCSQTQWRYFVQLGLVSHTFQKATAVRKLARVGVASKRSITYAILRLC